MKTERPSAATSSRSPSADANTDALSGATAAGRCPVVVVVGVVVGVVVVGASVLVVLVLVVLVVPVVPAVVVVEKHCSTPTSQSHIVTPARYNDSSHAHQPNAWWPMLVTLSGMTTEARLVHWANAEPPMLVTLSGMTTEARLLHPENAWLIMLEYEHRPQSIRSCRCH